VPSAKTDNCTYANGVLSRPKALTFRSRDIAASGGYPLRQLVLCPEDFGWMVFPDVEPLGVGVALADGLCDLGGRGSLRLKASMIGETGRAPFQLCPGICLTTAEKHG
jgi:hypothetical protein